MSSRQHSPTRPPPSPERHRAHSDSVKQLISQKRDVSYVQLALDLRRRQIQRLEQFAALRATTLQRAEAELEADAAHFDKFLRQNNEDVQVAVRRADQQASIRQDKVCTGRRCPLMGGTKCLFITAIAQWFHRTISIGGSCH